VAREVLDKLGFEVEPEEHARYAKFAADSVVRDRELRAKWDALLRKAGWSASAWVSREELIANPKFRYLVFKGIPGAFRPALWMILSGAQELRAREPANYYSLLLRAVVQDLGKLPAAEEVEKDLHRTFPGHPRFAAHATHLGVDPLRRILLAYSVRNAAIGYCQSLNVLGGWLLLVMPTEEDAFWVMCAVVENAVPRYYTQNMIGCQVDLRIFRDLLQEHCPGLVAHFEKSSLSLSLAATKWFLCLYVGIVPTDATLRIWDNFFLHGTLMLFRVGVALLRMFEVRLTSAGADLVQALQTLPRSVHDHRELFRGVRALITISHRRIDAMHAKYSTEVKRELQQLHKSKDVQALLRVTSFTREELSRLWNKFTSREGASRTPSGNVALNYAQFQELFLTAVPGWKPDSLPMQQLFRIFD
jgi:hypothetical protein